MQFQVWTLILAAGASRRMGRPKALLALGNKTFLVAIAEHYRRLGLPVVVVFGPDLEKRLPNEIAWTRTVLNPHVDAGPLSSLRLGLELLPETASAAIVHPVDHPLVSSATIGLLLEGHRQRPAHILVPEFGGEAGHPTLFPRQVFAELREGPLEGGARRVVEARPERVFRVQVDDPGILRNIDTPELYERWVAAPRGGADPAFAGLSDGG